MTKILFILNQQANWFENNLPYPLKSAFLLFRKTTGALYMSHRKGLIARCRFYLHHGHFFRLQIINNYLVQNRIRRLQIGGGIHSKKGWLNGDLFAGDIYLDVTHKLPLPNASIDYIFAEHFLEHLNYKQGKSFLIECYRVLKPKGKIRLSTPDLEKLINIYNHKNRLVKASQAMQRLHNITGLQVNTEGIFLNIMFRHWGHKFIYDYPTLKLQLITVGFSNVRRCLFGKSSDRKLVNLERHADVEWMKNGFMLIIESCVQ